MARRMVDICWVLVMSLIAAATPALAVAPASQATDPRANSPAGVIYSIPLDSARQDAAPHNHGVQHGTTVGGGGGIGSGGSGGQGGSGGPTGPGSVPGGSGQAGSAKPDAGASGTRGSASRGAGSTGPRATPILVPGGQPGSLLHSANGFGSSSSIPGLDAPAGSGLGAVQGNAGSAPALAVILTIVVMSIGAYAGVRAWRTPRPDPPDSPSSSA